MEVMFWAEVVEAAVAAGPEAEADLEEAVLLEVSEEADVHPLEGHLLEDLQIVIIIHRHRQDQEDRYL